MPRKNKELEKEYNRNYHATHRDAIISRHKKNSTLKGNTKEKSEYLKGWRDSHKEEIKEYQCRWRNNNSNSSKNREQWLRHHYGISTSEYDIILISQGGVCAICGAAKTSKSLPVDHEHVPEYEKMLPEEKRKHIRGILCSACNKALGLVKDDISILEKMIRYLRGYDE